MAVPNPPIGVEDAILTNFVNFLNTGVTDPVGAYAKVLEGWPDQDVRVQYPSIYVDITSGTRQDYPPWIQSTSDANNPSNPAQINAVVVLGSVDMSISVNIFADAKAKLGEIMGRYQKHMGEAAGEGGIHVPAPGYFDQEFTYEQDAPFTSMDSAHRVGSDEYRGITSIMGYGYEVAGLSGSKLINLSTHWYIAESDHLETVPVEIYSIFAP